MIESWQQDFTRCSHQYEIINYVTMATYWVPDLPNVRGFPGFFWHSHLIFFSDVLLARSCKHINVFKVDYLSLFNLSWLKFTKIVKTTRRIGKECVAMETWFNHIWKCVIFGTMSVASFNGFCRKLIEVASVICPMSNWVE